MELLDSIADTLHVLSETEDTSNFSRLTHFLEEGDTVVTFNYDLLMEQHLAAERQSDWSYRSAYALRPILNDCILEFDGTAPDQGSKFKILKPHGSCNWHFRFVPGTGPGFPGYPGYRIVPESIGVGNLVRDMRTASFLITDHSRKVVVEPAAVGYYERFMIPSSTYKGRIQLFRRVYTRGEK